MIVVVAPFHTMKARKRILLAISIIILGSLLIVALAPVAARHGNTIAIIPLSGAIAATEQGNLLTSTGITPSLVRSYLGRAEHDPAVKAVVLRLESPGGTVAASSEIAAIIQGFRDRSAKPVVVSMGDMATSAAYYISVYADRIVANPGTMTGSIGVIMQITDLSGLMEKLGVETKTLTAPAGGYKDIGNLPDSILQEMIDEMYEDFVAAIASGRSLPLAKVRELATGQPYSGKQARELGLVDQLGGLDEAVALAAGLAGVDRYQREWYGTSPSLLGRLLGLASMARQLLRPELDDDQALLIKALEGWQGVPRY